MAIKMLITTHEVKIIIKTVWSLKSASIFTTKTLMLGIYGV
jgi:hypothetical protein